MPDEPPLPPSHSRLPQPAVGAIRDSDHPEPLEVPSRSSGTLTPLPAPSLAGPHIPTVLPAKAGIQVRVAGRPHLQPPSHYQLPRSSGTLTPPPPAALAVPRTPTVLPAKAGIQGRVAGRPHHQPPSHPQLPHHTVGAVREPPVPQQRDPHPSATTITCRTAGPYRLTGESRYPGARGGAPPPPTPIASPTPPQHRRAGSRFGSP